MTVHQSDEDLPVPAGHSDADASQVLLADEAFDVAIGEDLPDFLAEGGVLHVAVQSNHAVVVLGQLEDGGAVGLAGGQLVSDRVARAYKIG